MFFFAFHVIYRYGPLIRHWTMQFEARHKYFKCLALATSLGNFINIAHTLAVRHQQMHCYLALERSTLSGEDLEVGPSEIIGCKVINSLSVTTGDKIYRCINCELN